MAFNSFVVYETVATVGNLHKIVRLRRTQAEADADDAADADLSAHASAVSTPDNALPDWYFNPVDLSFAPEARTAVSLVDERKTIHRGLLRQQELALAAIWVDAARVSVYGKWLEMQWRAARLDANFSKDVAWGHLHAEASIDGGFWYSAHQVLIWAAYLPDDRSGWTFWNTTPGTIRNTFGGVDRATAVAMDLATAYSSTELAAYTRGL